MIQRIQSIYLLLAGIFPAITFFTPLVLFTAGEKWITLSAAGYDTAMMTEAVGQTPYGLIVFTLLSVIIAWVAIFGYKNRRKQLRTVMFAIWSNLLWYAALAAYTFAMKERIGADILPQFCAFLPLLSLVALLMARRGIRHDEELVRAADRIR